MMDNEITINGKEYVLKGSDRFILPMDDANVIAVLSIPDGDNEVITLPGAGGLSFKKTSSLKDMTTKLGSDRATTINGTSIGVDFISKATSIEKILSYQGKIYFEVWERFDNKDNVVLKEHPVILRNGTRGYLIAPRISEEEK